MKRSITSKSPTSAPTKIKPQLLPERASTVRGSRKDVYVFERSDQLYSPTKKSIQYRQRKKQVVDIMRWGQRKLVIGVVQFFNHYWNPKLHPNPKCLYVGAAPGYTIIVMSELFPQIEWHLYDPKPFPDVVANTKNVFIYNKLFTDDELDRWKNESSLFFVSDIRNGDYKKASEENIWEAEAIIINDMMRQEKWVYSLKPAQALLKFRLPWIEGRFKELKGEFPYLQGHVLLQSWVSPRSTEGRLVPVKNSNGDYQSVYWDCVTYENVMFYHNKFIRVDNRYKNPFGEGNVDGNELINDWDSSNEVQIWRDYLTKAGFPDTQSSVVKLSRNLTNTLNKYLAYKTLSSIRGQVGLIEGPKVPRRRGVNPRIIIEKEEKEEEPDEEIRILSDDEGSEIEEKEEESEIEEVEEVSD